MHTHPKTVLITGGSRGIGHATALLFARQGWNVAFCARTAKDVERAQAQIRQAGHDRVLGLCADMGVREDIGRMFEAATGRFGAVDTLVNNAAILKMGAFPDSAGLWDDTWRVNVSGVVECCRLAFLHMRGRGGSIVNISSLAGIPNTGKFPGMWSYTISKFAVSGLTEALAVEGAPHGIRVNAVAPGATDTDMLRQAAPGLVARAKPADIAHVIHYLADDAHSGVLTGSVVPVFSNG